METLTFSDKDLKFKIPFGMIISGPSSSGKSTLLLKFIYEASDLIEPMSEKGRVISELNLGLSKSTNIFQYLFTQIILTIN